jgi:hypothetical protein
MWFDLIAGAVGIIAIVGYFAWKSETFRYQLMWWLGITLMQRLLRRYRDWKARKQGTDVPVGGGGDTGSDTDNQAEVTQPD